MQIFLFECLSIHHALFQKITSGLKPYCSLCYSICYS